MQRPPLLFLAFVSLLLCSCGKEIFFTNGEIMEEKRQLEGSFKVIELHDNVDVKLTHRTMEMTPGYTQVVVRTGKNLMPNINAEIHGDTLTIGNENILNWLRPYDVTIEMTVYYDSIQEIIFISNGNLVTDTLRGYDQPEMDSLSHLYLTIEGGSGDVQLLTHCRRLHTLYDFGTATATLKGNARIAYTSTNYNCHGPIDASKLDTNIHFVYAKGTNDIKVKAFYKVSGFNINNGSVYYLTYTGQELDPHSQHYYDVSCPEVVNITGDNIYPFSLDQ